MNTQPAELVEIWRNEAMALRRRGAEGQAMAVESCAEDLEQSTKEYELEELTLKQAASESGYSYSALQKQVADGRLRSVGGKHRPRIKRQDLPKKRRASRVKSDSPDLAGIVLGMGQLE